MISKILEASDIGKIVVDIGLDELYDQLIERLRFEFASNTLSSGQIPPRSGIHYSKPDLGLVEWMPASINKGQASLKLVGYHPTNPTNRGLPTVISSICMFDTNSGHLAAILDGTFLTALRTGAMSAVATSSLASERSKTLGIIGCGAQAVTQVHALSREMDIENIIAYDKETKALSSFSDRISFLKLPVHPVEVRSLDYLLENSDVICTCTSEDPGSGALFDDFENKQWLHINAIGSDFPGKFELPKALLDRSFVCPDFREQSMFEGECQQLESHQVFEDISGLLKKPELYKAKRSELTVFDSSGHAFADYVTGLLFLENADRLNLGSNIELECIPRDPKNPYSFLPKSSLRSIVESEMEEYRSL